MVRVRTGAVYQVKTIATVRYTVLNALAASWAWAFWYGFGATDFYIAVYGRVNAWSIENVYALRSQMQALVQN
jgi:hypothetical protein